MARWNTSPARPKAISRCWTSARITCGWMRAWSRHRPIGSLDFDIGMNFFEMARAGAVGALKWVVFKRALEIPAECASKTARRGALKLDHEQVQPPLLDTSRGKTTINGATKRPRSRQKT